MFYHRSFSSNTITYLPDGVLINQKKLNELWVSSNAITTLTNSHKNENCISAKNFDMNMATKTQNTKTQGLDLGHYHVTTNPET